MLYIKIADKLKSKCSDTVIGYIEAKVSVKEGSEDLWKDIDLKCNEIKNTYNQEDILKIKNIADSRQAYKNLGKDPSRYRLSSESLVKRIVKSNNLYKVNNVVDINNLVSLSSCYSVGVYDLNNISNDITFTIGQEGESYSGIGKGEINLENLPVFEDEKGKFGSTTSDSMRAMITENVNHIVMNIISFNGDSELNYYINYACDLLKKHADAQILNTGIVR